MKYELIRAEKAHFSIELMCRTLGISRSGYYAWLKEPESQRAAQDHQLAMHVQATFLENKKRYGSPRIKRELQSRGIHGGRHRIARLMRQCGLRARPRRRYVITTDSKHGKRVAPNIAERNFKPEAPNRLWASDITYIDTAEGWLYLTVVLDLYSRRVIGWSTNDTLEADSVVSALRQAIDARQPAPGLVFHSDRGSQYASHEVTRLLAANSLRQSMSRSGDCWDNAVVESFFSTLKTELGRRFPTRDEARFALFEYIDVFYNRRRLHSTLGYVSPVKYEENAA